MTAKGQIRNPFCGHGVHSLKSMVSPHEKSYTFKISTGVGTWESNTTHRRIKTSTKFLSKDLVPAFFLPLAVGNTWNCSPPGTPVIIFSFICQEIRMLTM